MIFRYPIMMGLGTKILTAYHHPTFKNGLMVAILNSKKRHPVGKKLNDEEYKTSVSSVMCEIHFDKIGTLDRYIENLQYIRDQWEKEVEE